MAFPIDQTPARMGLNSNSATADCREMFLKVFAGEVLTQFHTKCKALPLIRVRSLNNGASASFPMIGTNSAKYHTAGELIEANRIEHTELVVTADDFAISPVFIDELDEAMASYGYRTTYSTECATALATLIDRNIWRTIARAGMAGDKAAVEAAGGVTLTSDKYVKPVQLGTAGDELEGKELVSAIQKASLRMRTAGLSKSEKLYCVLPPRQYEALTNVARNVNEMPWMNRDVGGVGSAERGEVLKIAGVNIIESNNLPWRDESAGLIDDPEPLADIAVGSGRQAAYRGDFSNLVGLVFAKDACAMVRLKDVSLVTVHEEDRLGTTIYAKMLAGMNVFRHQCACAILKKA